MFCQHRHTHTPKISISYINTSISCVNDHVVQFIRPHLLNHTKIILVYFNHRYLSAAMTDYFDDSPETVLRWLGKVAASMNAPKTVMVRMPDMHQKAMTAGMHQMLSTGKYSDLTICCGPEEFKVHRTVVYPRSEFFAAICDGGFKVKCPHCCNICELAELTRQQEAETGRINMDDDDPAAVKRMLLYLYLQDYEDTEPEPSASWIPPLVFSTDDDDKPTMAFGFGPRIVDADEEAEALAIASHPRLLANISVYAVADKYDIPALKDLAKSKFSALAWGVWPHKDFSTVIHEVFESTPSSDSGLRDIVTKVCIEHIDVVLNEEQYTTVLQTTPPLTFALLQQVKTKSDEAHAHLSQKTVVMNTLLKERDEATERFKAWDRNVKDAFERAKKIKSCNGCRGREFEFTKVDHPTALRVVLRCEYCWKGFELC